MQPISLLPFRAVYAVTVLAACVDALFIAALPQGLRCDWTILSCLCAGVLLTLIGVALARIGRSRLAAVAFGLAPIYALRPLNQLAHFAPSYLGRNRAFVDRSLADIDRSLGFDWVRYFAFHADHPLFGLFCRIGYQAWPTVALGIVVFLAASGRVPKLARLLIATNLSLVVVYTVAAFTPSYGAYTFHGLTIGSHPNLFVQFSNYKPAYDALRQGIVDVYAATVPSGAISFPSFHTTTVVLYCWASWRTAAFPVVAVTQVLSVLAIRVQGAHFLTDMIAGGAIGILCIMASGPMIHLLGARLHTAYAILTNRHMAPAAIEMA